MAGPRSHGPITIAAARTTGGDSEITEAAFLTANPEARAYQRYAAAMATKPEVDFLVANPEARAFLRHVEVMAAKPKTDFLAANPEIEANSRLLHAAATVGK